MDVTEKQVSSFGPADVTYETKTSYKAVGINNKLKRLPRRIWNQVVAYMCHIAKENNTEAIVSLTIVRGKWKVICWHQYSQGQLHVKFNAFSEENLALLSEEDKAALEKVHCTVHSHNKSNAFQSGDDADDELGKEGWHITVGYCDKPALSTHCRFNCKQLAVFEEGKKVADAFQEFVTCDISVVLEPLEYPKGYPSTYFVSKDLIDKRNHEVPFPKAWVERAKKHVYVSPTTGTSSRSSGPTTTNGGSTGSQHNSTMGSKKNDGTDGGDGAVGGSSDKLGSIFLCSESDPFIRPINLYSPEWVLCQMIYQNYKQQNMVEDIISYSYTDQSLFVTVQLMMDKAEKYFIEEKGRPTDLVDVTFPDANIVAQYMCNILDSYSSVSGGEDLYSRAFEAMVLRKMYKEFQEHEVCGPIWKKVG